MTKRKRLASKKSKIKKASKKRTSQSQIAKNKTFSKKSSVDHKKPKLDSKSQSSAYFDERNQNLNKIRELELKLKDLDANERKSRISLNNKEILITEQKKSIKTLETDKANLKVEIIKLNEKFSEYNPDLFIKLENKIKYLEKELANLYADLDTADQEINDYIKERDNYSELNIELNRILSEKEGLLETRNLQFEKLSNDYDHLYAKIALLEKGNIKSKTSSKAKRRTSRTRSLKEVKEYLEIIKKMESRLKAKDDEIDELINRLEIQEIKIEELEDEINANEKARVRLEKAFNRLKSSPPKTA